MRDKDRAEDITFQIGQSKAIRNVIRGAVPQALIVGAIQHAYKCEASNMTPDKINETRSEAINSFATEFKITTEQLGEFMGDPDPAKWSIDKIINLRSVYRSLKSGDISIDEVFPPKEGPIKTGTEKLADIIGAGQEPKDETVQKPVHEQNEKPAETGVSEQSKSPEKGPQKKSQKKEPAPDGLPF